MARVDRRPRRRLGAEQRRAAILDAARQEFSHAPYDRVSLAAVAEAAGASEALVHRYFATKSGLHAEVVRSAVESLSRRQRDAAEVLGPHAPPRERLASSIEVYLDFVADAGEGWAAPLRNPHDGSVAAARLRVETRERYVGLLREVLGQPADEPRDHALRGYLGFLDAACLSWVDAGCPAGHRSAIVDMALGALDGALRAVEAGHPPDHVDQHKGEYQPTEPGGSQSSVGKSEDTSNSSTSSVILGDGFGELRAAAPNRGTGVRGVASSGQARPRA